MKEQAARKPRKKREHGLTKKVLGEIKNLGPHFTSHQLAARASISLEQAQKTCGYLKTKGLVRVIGSARITGSKGEPTSLYEPTEAYEKMRKEQPSLFSGLAVAPTPIEKAREAKEGSADPDGKNIKLLFQKVDGVIGIVDELINGIHLGLRQFSTTCGMEAILKVRGELKELKEIKPGA